MVSFDKLSDCVISCTTRLLASTALRFAFSVRFILLGHNFMVDTVKILGALLGGGGASNGSGSNVLKNILGAAVQGGQNSRGGADLGSLLGSVLGGQQGGGSGGGGIGDLLGSVLGGQQAQPQKSSGGLGGLLGGLLGGAKGNQAAPSGGGLGDLLGGVLSGQMQSTKGSGTDLGSLVSSALQQFGQAQSGQSGAQLSNFESAEQEQAASEQATLIIRAMIYAAKADGRLDDREQDKILGQLGEVTQEEIDFVKSEISKPLDVQGFIRSIPQGMGTQIYAMSLTAIDLDTNEEAQYLHELATGLNLDQTTVNKIHGQLGVRALYS